MEWKVRVCRRVAEGADECKRGWDADGGRRRQHARLFRHYVVVRRTQIHGYANTGTPHHYPTAWRHHRCAPTPRPDALHVSHPFRQCNNPRVLTVPVFDHT